MNRGDKKVVLVGLGYASMAALALSASACGGGAPSTTGSAMDPGAPAAATPDLEAEKKADACRGAIHATFSDVSTGSNAIATAFVTGPSPTPAVDGDTLTVSGANQAGKRDVTLALSSLPVSVGQTYALSSAGGAGTASLAYGQSKVKDEFNEGTWGATSGTVTVTALSSCFVSLAFTDAAMVATDPPGSGKHAVGTFTLAGSLDHAWLPCGTLDATFHGASGDVNTATFSTTGPTVTNDGKFTVSGFYFPDPSLNEPREILVTLGAPAVAGGSYTLSTAAPSATTARVDYLQSDNSTFGVDECWAATAGTLTVSSLDQCEVDFTITGASMKSTGTSSPIGFCSGLNDATGTFTLSVTGSGDPVSQ